MAVSPQRLRRLARDLVVDRVGGRVGLRVVRLPGRLIVFADTVDCLSDGRVSQLFAAPRVSVVVGWWTAPWAGWSGRLGPLTGVISQRVCYPRRGRGRVTIDLRLARSTPLREVLVAALFAVRPTHPLPVAPALGSGPKILVDSGRVNPRGRRPDAYGPTAPRFVLEFSPVGSALRSAPDNPVPWRWPGARTWRRGPAGDLAWPAIAALRSVGVVECPDAPGQDPVAEASLLVQLAMTGVVLDVGRLSESVADLLAPELRAVLLPPGKQSSATKEEALLGGKQSSSASTEETVPPGKQSGALELEMRSVRQRRAALRGHSSYFGAGNVPTVSALLATKRAEHLPTILRAIAGQTYPQLEIVLCLHGIELPAECRDLLDHCGRSVEIVSVSADVAFGSALGVATARASGVLVTKFDDDDTYGPEHVWDLVLARQYSGAVLVGKGIEFVYLEDANVTVRRRSGQPEAWADVVAGGTMLLARGELEELGGWRPVPRSVDRGLLDRLTRAGAMIYRTHPLGYLYHRRSQGHTWQADDDFFLRTARQRWDGVPKLAEFGTTDRGSGGPSAR